MSRKNKSGFTPAPKDRVRRQLDNKCNFLVRGFTLIELLVVIAIIGILASVVLVSLAGYRDRAIRSKVLQATNSFLPAVVECSLRNNNYVGTIFIAKNPGEIPCDGSFITAPPFPCASSSTNNKWYIYYDNFPVVKLKNTVTAWCDQESPRFHVRCYYAGTKSGTCEAHDWDDYKGPD